MMRASLITALALAAVTLGGCGAAETPHVYGHPWHVAYTGYGRVLASNYGAASITLQPARSTSPWRTHAALVLSSRPWNDVLVEVRLRTNRQLRLPHPNPWEVAWLLWDYGSNCRFYYVALKPNGWEIGKEEPPRPCHQRFLATGSTPAFPIGRRYVLRVRQRGELTEVYVDGRLLARVSDRHGAYLSGRIGLYSEDSSATFRPVFVR